MPLPFIPFLIAAGAYAGKRLKDANDTREVSQYITKESELELKRAKELFKILKNETETNLENYGTIKAKILSESIHDFYDVISSVKGKMGSRIIDERNDLANFVPSSPDFEKLKHISSDTFELVMTNALKTSATYAGGTVISNALVFGACGTSFATGTAASVLGGILGSVTGPVAILFGVEQLNKSADAEYYRARAYEDNVKTYKQEVKALQKQFEVINETTNQMSDILNFLNEKLNQLNSNMRDIVRKNNCQFRDYPKSDVMVFLKAIETARTIKDVIETEIMLPNGEFNSKLTDISIEFTKQITNDNIQQVHSSSNTQQQIMFSGKEVCRQNGYRKNNSDIIRFYDGDFYHTQNDSKIVIDFSDGTQQVINPDSHIPGLYYKDIIAFDCYQDILGVVINHNDNSDIPILIFRKEKGKYRFEKSFNVGNIFCKHVYDTFQGIGHPMTPVLSLEHHKIMWGVGERNQANRIAYLYIDYENGTYNSCILPVSMNSDQDILNYLHYFNDEFYYLSERDSKIVSSKSEHNCNINFKYTKLSDSSSTLKYPFAPYPLKMPFGLSFDNGLGDFCIYKDLMFALPLYYWLENQVSGMSYISENQLAVIDMTTGDVLYILQCLNKITSIFIALHYLFVYEQEENTIEYFDLNNNFRESRFTVDTFFGKNNIYFDEVTNEIIVFDDTGFAVYK